MSKTETFKVTSNPHLTNASEVIQKLRKFNFPILRGSVQIFQIEEMEKEVNEIENSIKHFRNYLQTTKDSIKTSENLVQKN